MGKIAIVVNPNSGKDIRRLVTRATVFGNYEKVNILQRIITAIFQFDRHEIYIIPDRERLALQALKGLDMPELSNTVTVPDMRIIDRQEDTVEFVRRMVQETRVDAVIALGGDGTCRAVAKVIGDTPLIALSTGTNNVYPDMCEGTVAGLAAAGFAAGAVSPAEFMRDKRIDIRVYRGLEDGGEALIKEDIALVDAALSRKSYTGARALLEADDILSVFVTRAHPASIGFSALAGSVHILKPDEDRGLFLKFDWQGSVYTAAISAGAFARFDVIEKRLPGFGETIDFTTEHNGTVAVDGEREVTFRAGDRVVLSISRNGPRKVDIFRAVESAQKNGFFGETVKLQKN